MVSIRRPSSASEARNAYNNGYSALRAKDENFATACEANPVLYTEMRWDEKSAASLCGRGSANECPLLALCEPLGYTESVYADDFVYGGIPWRRGRPVVSRATPEATTAARPVRARKYF